MSLFSKSLVTLLFELISLGVSDYISGSKN